MKLRYELEQNDIRDAIAAWMTMRNSNVVHFNPRDVSLTVDAFNNEKGERAYHVYAVVEQK